jgi:phosphoglycolate phosphatase
MVLKAVIFDWDGTLVDSAQAVYDTHRELCRRFGKMFPYKSLQDMKNRVEVNWRRLYAEEYGFTPQEQIARQAMYKEVMSMSPHVIRLFSGMKDALRSFKDAHPDVKLGIATSNVRSICTTILAKEGMDGFFDAIVTYKEVKDDKPHPDMLLKIMEMLAVRPEEAVYVGDIGDDIRTAENAGMRCVAVSYGFQSLEKLRRLNPKAEANDVKELFSVLERVYAE